MRSLTPTRFRGWHAMALHDSGLTLRVVPEVGGRLMSIALHGHELCFIHPQLEGKVYCGQAEQWPALCGDWSFPLWGGGKTWVAPEADWPDGAPHRDLDSLPWTLEDYWIHEESMGVQVRSQVCSRSGLQLSRRIVLPANSTHWTVEHELRNAGAREVTCGLWDVLMLQRPSRVTVPQAPVHALHALPGKPPVSALQEAGVVGVAEGGAYIECVAPYEFKCGFHSEDGRIEVQFRDLPVRYSRRSAVDAQGLYAHGHPLEVFNAPKLDYFEIETHSLLHTLRPSEGIRYVIHESVSLA